MALACLAVLLIAVPAFAQSASGVGSNAQILGAEDQSKQIAVTFWLNQRDKAGFDELVRQMYDRNSPNYHHWLKLSEYESRFAPSAENLAVVRQHLAANNLQVVGADKLNHYVTAHGTVADVQRATGVQLNRVLVNGEVHRLPSALPVIPGAAGKAVLAVQGLSDLQYENHAMRQIDPDTGKPAPGVPLSQANSIQKYYNANCLRATQVKDFKTNGGAPYAIYSGARYGGNITSLAPNLPPCGYDAPEVEKAYGLTSLYKQKLDGTGQTVVLVDAYGSDTILSDGNAFSSINHLPQLTPDNFQIFYPTGPTNCGGTNTCGWDLETSLDVEWSHAVAPGATITLILAADPSFTNLDLAVLYAIEIGFGPAISNSYGIGEIVLATEDPGELTIENSIFELAAALGMSVNFSSGDGGDYLATYKTTTVSAQAASPYATGVGGTSLFLNSNGSMKLQTGWGNNLTRIATYAPNPPIIPPLSIGFDGGSGGGTSAVWAKPSFQEKLSGNWRLVPDIAFLADPWTGGEVVYTEGGQQSIGVVGGTSLACPMFSGMWAIANQAAPAGTWLGQAAPLLYGLPANAITDVTDVNGPDNVSGVINAPPAPPVYESPQVLAGPLSSNITNFVSLLYNGVTTRWYVISFGTDTSLTTGSGWDNVTGLGTPNGANFVTAVNAAAK
ncbi:MAG: S53 family peptidase [Terriglobales bacterium]|jgi:subtilase family serine protease